MGKTEKIVVLSILFLVVLLFVWSMGDQEAGAADRSGPDGNQTARYSGGPNLGKGRGATANGNGSATGSQGRPGPAAGWESGSAPKSPGTAMDPAKSKGPGTSRGFEEGALLARPSGGSPSAGAETRRIELEGSSRGASNVLNAVVERDSKNGESVPQRRGGALRQTPAVHMRPGWDIVTTDGLEATVNPDMLLYRPKTGATWETLAVDLYGDASKEVLLRHNNEGTDAPGEVIFVPAKDDGVEDFDTRVVEVLKGETLWQVSKRTLGRGSRWRELFEANRDVISDPDFLSPGTILTVPAQ